MKVLGLIPARGGSKGVVRKNIRLLCGKPLIAYTAESALQAKNLSRVILSTDDEEIAAIGRQSGLEVPFMRPPELALDTTPTLPVIKHALKYFQDENIEFDAVCLLQPTSPLRRAEDIDNCIDLLSKHESDSVVSVLPVPTEYNPKWVFWRNEDGTINLSSGDAEPVTRRQDLPPAYHRDGSIYIARVKTIFDFNNLYGRNIQGYCISPEYSANIDTMTDWEKLERRLVRQNSARKS